MNSTKTERVAYSPDELRGIAERLSANITVVDGSKEVRRSSKKHEKQILYGLFLGALLSLNAEDFRRNREKERAVLDTVEHAAIVMFKDILKDGVRIQSYISVFCPLKKVLDEWRVVD